MTKGGTSNTDRDMAKRVAGVILAAGMATRMGAVKQLLPFRGKPLLAQVLENARSAGCLDSLIVVLGHKASDISREIDFGDSCVVIADDYALGQSASLKAGLSVVPEDCKGVLFLLGDQPLISPEIIGQVVTCFIESGADIIIPTYDGQRGNPVLIGRSFFSQLALLSGDVGARSLFLTHPQRIREIEITDLHAYADIDTWDDYRKLSG